MHHAVVLVEQSSIGWVVRLSEVYTSVQGEGPNTGVPIQFVRFGGCNMRCPGWPCDTQFAIDPTYSDTWEKTGVDGVLDRVAQWPRHVCLTGGEPLIQIKSQVEFLGERLLATGYNIDLFTNGSQPFPSWAASDRVTTVMDWKLEGSGEKFTGLPQRRENLDDLWKGDALKFVVKDSDDLAEAHSLYVQHLMHMRPFDVFVGACWGEISDQEIIQFLQDNELNWRLNVQVHKHIWEPTLRGV